MSATSNHDPLCSGYTLEAQKSLFDNIKPLFSNKPLMVIANKKDVWNDNLTDEKKAIMDSFEAELVTIGCCQQKFEDALQFFR